MLKQWKEKHKVNCYEKVCVIHEHDLQKLVTEIVMECIGICMDYSNKTLKYSQFGSNAAMDCAKLIQEHFDEHKNKQ